MISFFVSCFVLGFIFNLFLEFAFDQKKELTEYEAYEKLFFNTPEQNIEAQRAATSLSRLQSLLSNVGAVLIIALCYWMCLSAPVH